jgi:alpha-ketoglutarate-dependent taurine dioxygenase
VQKCISLSQEALVRTKQLFLDSSLPLVAYPVINGVDLIQWAENNLDFIDEHLSKHGGLLFRGFGVKSPEEFERFIRAVCAELLPYKERSSPRTQVSGNIYSSTDYPADHSIFLHNENSYQNNWPLKIFFSCQRPAERGGETPIADCRRVFRRIAPDIRERFIEKGWMYVRNFGDGFGLDWQTVFQTDDKSAVEEHCRDNDIEVEWKYGDRLRTRAVRPAVRKHPKTGEEVWFNHATFFHISTLEPQAREFLLEEFAEDDLPTNTFYGDGSAIEPSVVDQLRAAYLQETIVFPWQRGDILMLDNVLTAHGRKPYIGSRKILVGMAELGS